jgi:hypothetical protein
MSTSTETQTGRERYVVYLVVGGIVAVAMVVGLFTFHANNESARAQAKADQLISALEQTGARTPDKDQVVRVLGDDGGATCADPNAALTRAVLLSQLSNGAAFVGLRPVIADSRAVRGQLLILKVYCPDELKDFQKFVDDLKTDNVAS